MNNTSTHTPMFSVLPSDRVEQIKEYYFSRKLREIARLKAEGHDIISLGIGGPDMPPPADVIDTLTEQASRSDTHSYQPGTGAPELRQAFAEWYKKYYGVVLNPYTELLPLIGSKEGVMHISMAFLNAGDGVLVPNPGYPTYTSASRLVGAEIYPYDLTEQNGWLPDFKALERLPLDRIKLMWVNYPHMPTGTQPTRKLLEDLIAFGRKHSIVIAHDNPYSFILNDTPMSILSVPGAMDVALELNSLSKSHNMAGWRVAMVASNPQFIEWVYKVKSNVDSGQFRPIMLAAAKALMQPPQWYENINKIYASRRTIAEKIMHTLGCKFDSAQRGLFLWGKIPDNEVFGEALADKLLYETGVFITPGFIFGSNGHRYVRVSLCATEDNLNEALHRIKTSYK